MKRIELIILIFISVVFSGCLSFFSPKQPLMLRVKMIQRLIGVDDTEGWGSDLGVSFIHKGKIYFLGGDTNKKDFFAPNIIGFTEDIDPSDGLNINWKKDEKGNPKEFFSIIEPSSTVPAGAISISNKIYIFMMDVINWDYPTIARSILIKSEDDGRTFRLVWEGKLDDSFVNISPVISEHPNIPDKDAIYLIGSGKYRESPIYLAVTEIDSIEDRSSYFYFAGIKDGSPIWKKNENDIVPIVDDVKVGELSVQWNSFLGKWLLSYFEYSNGNPGNLFFRTASNLWGPWSYPVLIYNGTKHYNWYEEVITREGKKSWGIPYGSYLLPETSNIFSSKIYFTLSLWIPYSIFLMEVDLTILDVKRKLWYININLF